MIGTGAVYYAVMHCDLLLMVGTDYPYSNFLPHSGIVVQIDERPEVLGRRAPTMLGVAGSARPTLKLLLDQVASKQDTRFWDRVSISSRHRISQPRLCSPGPRVRWTRVYRPQVE